MPSPFRLKNGKIKICAVMLRKMGVLLYKGPVYMESFVAYPSYPACRANFSYIFLHTWRTVYARNKKLARPAGDPPKPRFTLFQWTGPSNDWNPRFILFQGSGHPSNRANFSPYKHSGSTWSRRDNQSWCERCCQILALVKGPILTLAKDDSAGRNRL